MNTMKPKNSLLLCLTFTFALPAITTSCTHKSLVVKSSKPLPPGQAKKLTGSKSAKPYAPGQQKKQ